MTSRTTTIPKVHSVSNHHPPYSIMRDKDDKYKSMMHCSKEHGRSSLTMMRI